VELEPADEVKVTAIIENTSNKPGFYAEHGLSMLIEIISEDKTTKILMDAGQSTFAFLNNAQRLKIDLTDIDVIVISHGHFDHTGALLDILRKMPKRIPIIGHPNMFDKKYSKHARLRYIGVPFSKDDLQHAGILTLTKTPVKVAPSACTTGEINRTSISSLSNKLLTKKNNNSLVKDELLDDQALVVNLKKGLVIIAGCAHSGIVNIIFHSQKLTNRKEIIGVIGGFHLVESDPETIKAVLEILNTLNPTVIAPCHCTGFLAQKIFSDNLEGFKLFNTGTILKI
jgi:7,8-dihydropterin-6-yl-methyl-4-(beta-D-ribofuranosyl)aminobenzene 5'-phosphate synthase